MTIGFLEPINTIISVIALILGSSLFVQWWKNRKSRFVIHDISGSYQNKKTKIEGISSVTITVDVAFFNDSHETVSVTDLLGTLKYNKERFKILQLQGLQGVNEVFSANPSNFIDVIPFTILPHESVKKTLTFNFPAVFFDFLSRLPIPKFIGLLDSGLPLYFHSEKEFKENWIKNPPTMLLTAHVNAKNAVYRYFPIFEKNGATASGTFSVVDVKKIENSFREKD